MQYKKIVIQLKDKKRKWCATMISFVICEDEKVFAHEYKNEIDKFMMQFDFEYKCYLFSGYDTKFKSFARKNKDFKIYLFDVKTDCGSGIDATRFVREEIDDWSSMIIIITSFNEYKYEALSKRLLILDYINKVDNYKGYLRECLTKCIKFYDDKPKKLRYTYKNAIYNIEYKHIVYISKEPESKKSTIHTDDGRELPYQAPISKLMEALDDRFLKVSRNTVINLDQISHYETKTSTIHFKTGASTNEISRENKRKIVRYVRGLK